MDTNPLTTAESERVTLVNWSQDTHLLVQFCEEDSTSIVPIKRVKMKENMAVGDKCSVVWSNNKVYIGTVMCSGSIETCAAMQEDLDESDSDEQEKLIENRPDHLEIDSQALKDRNNLRCSDLQEIINLDFVKTQGNEKEAHKVLETDKPQVNTEKPKNKISQNGKENNTSKRKSKATDKPKSKKKKGDFELWIGHSPSTSKINNQSGNSTVADTKPSQDTDKALQYEHLFGEIGNVKEIVQQIRKDQDAQFQQLKKQLEGISTTTKSILATKVAEKLTALIPPTKEQTASAPATKVAEKLTALIPPTEEQTASAPEQPLVLSSSTEKHPSVTMSAEA